MAYLVVASWNADNKITGENRAPDEAAAIIMRDSMIEEGYTGAFYTEVPSGNSLFWEVDPATETVSYNNEADEESTSVSNWVNLRTERDTKLSKSDWTQYTDSPLISEAKTEWSTYRQELRDLPANTDDPANPTWPVAPS